MRITSPPKYHGEKRIQSSFAQKSIKQKLYEQLQARQKQYVNLIQDLHQENKHLKQQLDKFSQNQSLKQTLSSNWNLNQIVRQNSFKSNKPNNFSSRNFLNQTHNHFNHVERQNTSPLTSKIMASPKNLSPRVFYPTGGNSFGSNVPFRNVSPLRSPVQFKQPMLSSLSPKITFINQNKNVRWEYLGKKTELLNQQSISFDKTSSNKENRNILKILSQNSQKLQQNMKSIVAQNSSIKVKKVEFNLEQNISKNPLLSMLRQKLSCQQSRLNDSLFNKDGDDRSRQFNVSFNTASQYNQNIRFQTPAESSNSSDVLQQILSKDGGIQLQKPLIIQNSERVMMYEGNISLSKSQYESESFKIIQNIEKGSSKALEKLFQKQYQNGYPDELQDAINSTELCKQLVCLEHQTLTQIQPVRICRSPENFSVVLPTRKIQKLSQSQHNQIHDQNQGSKDNSAACSRISDHSNMKYLNLSNEDTQSVSTLRSQRLKKISNKAYL